MSKGIEPIRSKDPQAILGPGKRKYEREIVEDQEETAGTQSCKRKRLIEVLKVPNLHHQSQIYATHSTIELKIEQKSAKNVHL